jgi:hypothetical protein
MDIFFKKTFFAFLVLYFFQAYVQADCNGHPCDCVHKYGKCSCTQNKCACVEKWGRCDCPNGQCACIQKSGKCDCTPIKCPCVEQHGHCDCPNGQCACIQKYGKCDCKPIKCPCVEQRGHCDCPNGQCACIQKYGKCDCKPNKCACVEQHGHCDCPAGPCTYTQDSTPCDCPIESCNDEIYNFFETTDSCQITPLPQHQFYIGPEIFYLERSKDAKYKRSNQHGFVYGGRIGYDRIKRCKIYWGGDLVYATGDLHGKKDRGNSIKIDYTDFDVEGRLGYTFQLKRSWLPTFVPFVGYGYIRETSKFKKPSPIQIKQHISFDYFTVGFLSQIYPHPLWVVGVNFKARFLFNSKCKISDDPDYEDITQNVEHKVQYRVELPVTYRLNAWCERLAIALVPFYEFRHYGEHANFPFDFKDARLNFYGFDVRILYMF